MDSGVADGVITSVVTFDASASATAIVMFRTVDGNNLWQVTLDSAGASLYKIDSGTPTPVDIEATGLAANTPHTVTITLSGPSINAVVNAMPALTASDSFQATETKHGMGGYSAGTGIITVDDFKVDGF